MLDGEILRRDRFGLIVSWRDGERRKENIVDL